MVQWVGILTPPYENQIQSTLVDPRVAYVPAILSLNLLQNHHNWLKVESKLQENKKKRRRENRFNFNSKRMQEKTKGKLPDPNTLSGGSAQSHTRRPCTHSSSSRAPKHYRHGPLPLLEDIPQRSFG